MSRITPAEQEILDIVLRELRDCASTREQLQILIDPYVTGGGANICISKSAVGYSQNVDGEITRRRSRRRG